MKHYLILKLQDASDTQAVAALAREVLGRLPGELAGVRSVLVSENCAARAENHDLMIEMDMADEGVLAAYLAHERHAEFVTYAGPRVTSKVTFDKK